MNHSTKRILTTHVGSLPRPTDLLDLMKAKISGAPYDANAYARAFGRRSRTAFANKWGAASTFQPTASKESKGSSPRSASASAALNRNPVLVPRCSRPK